MATFKKKELLQKWTIDLFIMGHPLYCRALTAAHSMTSDEKYFQVPQVAEYIKEFHPEFVGLTGTEEQVKKVFHFSFLVLACD